LRHHGCGPGRSRVGLHRVRDRRPSLLRLARSWPQSRIDDVAHGRRAARRLLRGAGRARLAAGSVAGVLLEGRFAHVRQWPRHRPVPRERTRAADALAERARFPRRGGHGDDQPRPRRHHGNVRRVPRRRATHRLPSRRFLGFCHLDDRYLLAFVPLDLDRRDDQDQEERRQEDTDRRGDGFWGSVTSTIGIFLPSFLLILIVAPILVRYRTNPNVQGFIKGAYAAAIGTILGACVLLGKIAIGDWLTALIALASLVVLFRWKVSNPLLVAATAVIGLIAFPLLRPEWVFVK